MNVVDVWNGRRAGALRRALRLTNEGFAEKLGAATRTVAKWAQNPDAELTPDLQLALDTMLENAGERAQSRFALLLGEDGPRQGGRTAETAVLDPVVEQRIRDDLHINAAIDWLAKQSTLSPGEIRREVTSTLQTLDHDALRERGHRRGQVGQEGIATALQQYYAGALKPYGTYSARVGASHTAQTSLFTRPEWIDLRCHLVAENDAITLDATTPALPSRTSTSGFTTQLPAESRRPWPPTLGWSTHPYTAFWRSHRSRGSWRDGSE